MNKSISELNLLVEALRQIRTSKDYDTRSWYKTIVKMPQIIDFKYGKFEVGNNKGKLFCMHFTIYGKHTGTFKRLSIDSGMRSVKTTISLIGLNGTKSSKFGKKKFNS